MLVMDADGDALLMDGDVAGDVGMVMFIGEPLKPMLWWIFTHQFHTSSWTGPAT
jgi:hypothetical protein